MRRTPKSYYATIWATCRGNSIYQYKDNWYYLNGLLYDGKRLCQECKLPHILDGPDPCLGWKPGVTSMCCGHGGRQESVYITTKRLTA